MVIRRGRSIGGRGGGSRCQVILRVQSADSWRCLVISHVESPIILIWKATSSVGRRSLAPRARGSVGSCVWEGWKNSERSFDIAFPLRAFLCGCWGRVVPRSISIRRILAPDCFFSMHSQPLFMPVRSERIAGSTSRLRSDLTALESIPRSATTLRFVPVQKFSVTSQSEITLLLAPEPSSSKMFPRTAQSSAFQRGSLSEMGSGSPRMSSTTPPNPPR
jgi:hypothetical protein